MAPEDLTDVLHFIRDAVAVFIRKGIIIISDNHLDEAEPQRRLPFVLKLPKLDIVVVVNVLGVTPLATGGPH